MLYAKSKPVSGSLAPSLSLALSLALAAASAGVSAESISGTLINARLLTAVDVPPPEYPKHADAIGIDGYAVLEFTVAPDGRVASPEVRSHSSSVFSKAAIEAVETWQFEPVYENGVAVPIRTGYKFSFVPRTAD